MPVTLRLQIPEETRRRLDRIDPASVDRALFSSKRDFSLVLKRTLTKTSGRVTKKRTGTYARSWQVRPTEEGINISNPARSTGSDKGGGKSTPTLYARHIEEGTGLFGPRHRVIRPTRKKALSYNPSRPISAFKPRASTVAKRDANQVVFASVKGMKPRRTLAITLRVVLPRFFKFLGEDLERELG